MRHVSVHVRGSADPAGLGSPLRGVGAAPGSEAAPNNGGRMERAELLENPMESGQPELWACGEFRHRQHLNQDQCGC